MGSSSGSSGRGVWRRPRNDGVCCKETGVNPRGVRDGSEVDRVGWGGEGGPGNESRLGTSLTKEKTIYN